MKAWVQERRPSNIEELTDAVQEYRRAQLTPQLCNGVGPYEGMGTGEEAV